MFKRPTKKQLLLRRIFFSSVATLSVLIILTVTILFLQGFRLDSGNRLAQGALLQFNSTPNAANVFIDGKNINVRTAGKHTVVAGTHSVLFQKDRYEDWTRRIDFLKNVLPKPLPTSRQLLARKLHLICASSCFTKLPTNQRSN